MPTAAFPNRSRLGTSRERATRHDAVDIHHRSPKERQVTIDSQPEAPTVPSLYERIGGRATLERVVPDVIALHLENPIVGERFRNAPTPIAELERHAIEFFHSGLSGESTYVGRSMPEAHAGMAITAEEYIAVLDDIVIALERHGVGATERAELLAIAYSMKNDIVGL
jgi:hemoglobin